MIPGADAGVLATAPPDAMVAIETILLLLIIVTALAILARRIAVPYPILLVIGGLLLGFVPGLPQIELEPDLVFVLFLPPILFAAGYFTSVRDIRMREDGAISDEAFRRVERDLDLEELRMEA